MLQEAILEIVGVPNIVGAVSALENVHPEGHCQWFKWWGRCQGALTLRQAQGERLAPAKGRPYSGISVLMVFSDPRL